jgi:hypothetical protein
VKKLRVDECGKASALMRWQTWAVLIAVGLILAYAQGWIKIPGKQETTVSIAPCVWLTAPDGTVSEIDLTLIKAPVLGVVKVAGVTVNNSAGFGFKVTTTATVNDQAATGSWNLSGTVSSTKPSKSASVSSGAVSLGSNYIARVDFTKADLEALGSGSFTSTVSISGTVTVTTTSPEAMTGTKTFSSSYNLTIDVTTSTLTITVTPETSVGVG